MRSLQHDLGKRSPLFIYFDPSNRIDYTFNKTPGVPIIHNSSAATPADSPPEVDLFTGSYNADPADPYSAWIDSGAAPLSFDGSTLSDSPNVYEITEAGNRRTEQDLRNLQLKQPAAGAGQLELVLATLLKIFSSLGANGAGGTKPETPPPTTPTPTTSAAPASPPDPIL